MSSGELMEAEPAYAVAVVGAGALGLKFAHRISRVHPVAVVARSAARAAALAKGVEIDGTRWQPPAFAPNEAPPAAWALVVVKTPDTAAAAAIAGRIARLGVLSLQNGLVETTLRRHAGRIRAGQGITSEGAYRESGPLGERVVSGGDGQTLLPAGFEPMAAILRDAGFDAWVETGLQAARLAKLLVNLVLNPLTALNRVNNGALIEPPLAEEAQRLVMEAMPILRAEGLPLSDHEALAHLRKVARATAMNRSSMLQDVLAGRPTEADAITGELLRMAGRHGMRAPAHEALLRRLGALPASPAPIRRPFRRRGTAPRPAPSPQPRRR